MPFRVVLALADRVVAVVGAVAFSQFPAFIQHYLQRLGGHIAEAQRSVLAWQDVARGVTNGGIPALIAQYQASSAPGDPLVAAKCAADVARLVKLQGDLSAITDASAWGRGWAFLMHYDPAVVRATAGRFTPNVPLDMESLVYAAVGLLVAAALCAAVRALGTTAIRKVKETVRVRRILRSGGCATGQDCRDSFADPLYPSTAENIGDAESLQRMSSGLESEYRGTARERNADAVAS